MGYRKQTITVNDQWRNGTRGAMNTHPGTLKADNADVNGSGTVTTYGKVYAGTILAEDATGDLHPCGLAELAENVAASADCEIAPLAAKNFYIGDQVAVVKVPAQEQTIAVTGEADTEVFTAASVHDLAVGDTVDLSALTGGTGAAAGVYTVATVPSDTTFTLTGVAYTTDITAGTLTVQRPNPLPVNITGTRNIEAIDQDTGEITLSGAVFSATAGDLLIKIGAYKPAGILVSTETTLRYVDATEVTEDIEVSVALEGDAREDYVRGLGTKLKELLSGAPYIDPLDGVTRVVPKFAGFVIRDL